jgi:hypothetical protein
MKPATELTISFSSLWSKDNITDVLNCCSLQSPRVIIKNIPQNSQIKEELVLFLKHIGKLPLIHQIDFEQCILNKEYW